MMENNLKLICCIAHAMQTPKSYGFNSCAVKTIPKAKYLDIVSLCQANIIPRAHHPLYILLPNE